jgi:hypothetical protein
MFLIGEPAQTPGAQLMPQRNQRGMSLSAFIVVLLPALVVMIGLVVDGGAQAAGERQAQWVAAAAARAACDQTAASRVNGAQANTALAVSLAKATIAAEPGVTGQVQIIDRNVVVHTQVWVPTTMLGIIGIDHLTASGSAEARLVADR